MTTQPLPTDFACACGRRHTLPIREIVLESGGLQKLAGARERLGFARKTLLVADTNTYEIAGRRAEELLAESGPVKRCLFETRAKIVPDERALVYVLAGLDPEVDLLAAAGSGTLNDLVRYISARTGLPFISIPTAPSMDGYTSVVAPLIIGGFKKPHVATHPLAVYADLDILKEAPRAMIAAGFGDLLGKFTAKADWLLGRMIQGEGYCEAAMDLVMNAVKQSIAGLSGITARQPEAIRALTEGLLNTGVAMLWMGSSRPASGAEHILAHFWEMKSLLRGEFKHLHGEEVAVATVLIARVYQRVLALDCSRFDPVRLAQALPDETQWRRDVERVYGPLAGEVFQEQAGLSFAHPEREAAIQRILETAVEWQKPFQTWLPSPEQMIDWLQAAGAPALPADLGLGPEAVREGLLQAQKSRNRYTILNVAAELGVLDQMVEELIS
jgi:glycerol-1-phosphate dehydrogenase [NAD(P)+]